MLIGLFFLSLYVLTMGGHLDSPDEEVMFRVTRSLAERLSFDVGNTDSPEYASYTGIGVDGRAYAPYGPVSSILSVPFYEVGRGAAALMPTRYSEVAERFAVNLRDPVFSAAGCILFYLLALELGFDAPVALILTLAFGTATLEWPFSKYSWSEPVTGFFVLLSVFAAMRATRGRGAAWATLSGVALGIASGSKITTMVVAPILLLYLAVAGGGALVASQTLRDLRRDPARARRGSRRREHLALREPFADGLQPGWAR